MPTTRKHVTDELLAGFAVIRRDLGIPETFPPEVIEVADRRSTVRTEVFASHVDRRDVELTSIDPDGTTDLDQAFRIDRDRNGWILRYAIADIGAWVHPGDPIDVEARRRGTTVYSPDRRIPLHPPVLSEGVASLHQGQDTPALLWRIRIDGDGELGDATVERAIVRNRRALSYREVQGAIDAGTDDDQFLALRELGRVLRAAEAARGGVSLELPEQSVVQVEGHYEIRYDPAWEVEAWNAQLSLATGMAAARLMIDNGVGILRTLPPADPQVFDSLRRSAAWLGVDWPAEMPYPTWLRSLDPSTPYGAALMTLASRTLRGSDYLAFDGDLPDYHEHAAIAAPYAHVTAPLRRLVDRFANECALAAVAGERPPGWVLDALLELPGIMARTGALASRVDHAAVDLAEAAALLHLVGETFEAMVTASAKGRSTLQLHDPAVIHSIDADLPIGTTVRVRLVEASLVGPTVTFELAD